MKDRVPRDPRVEDGLSAYDVAVKEGFVGTEDEWLASLQGPQGTPGSAPQAYVHDQAIPSMVWTINHNLGYHPNVTVIDSGGTEWIGDIAHLSDNAMTDHVHVTVRWEGVSLMTTTIARPQLHKSYIDMDRNEIRNLTLHNLGCGPWHANRWADLLQTDTDKVRVRINGVWQDLATMADVTAGGISSGIVDAKGDLIAASGADAVTRLPVGCQRHRPAGQLRHRHRAGVAH